MMGMLHVDCHESNVCDIHEFLQLHDQELSPSINFPPLLLRGCRSPPKACDVAVSFHE